MNKEVIELIRSRAWAITGGIIFSIFSISFSVLVICVFESEDYYFHCNKRYASYLAEFIMIFLKSLLALSNVASI